jgi:hypothetical protein
MSGSSHVLFCLVLGLAGSVSIDDVSIGIVDAQLSLTTNSKQSSESFPGIPGRRLSEPVPV